MTMILSLDTDSCIQYIASFCVLGDAESAFIAIFYDGVSIRVVVVFLRKFSSAVAYVTVKLFLHKRGCILKMDVGWNYFSHLNLLINYFPRRSESLATSSWTTKRIQNQDRETFSDN